jgi:hypothetical protein
MLRPEMRQSATKPMVITAGGDTMAAVTPTCIHPIPNDMCERTRMTAGLRTTG